MSVLLLTVWHPYPQQVEKRNWCNRCGVHTTHEQSQTAVWLCPVCADKEHTGEMAAYVEFIYRLGEAWWSTPVAPSIGQQSQVRGLQGQTPAFVVLDEAHTWAASDDQAMSEITLPRPAPLADAYATADGRTFMYNRTDDTWSCGDLVITGGVIRARGWESALALADQLYSPFDAGGRWPPATAVRCTDGMTDRELRFEEAQLRRARARQHQLDAESAILPVDGC